MHPVKFLRAILVGLALSAMWIQGASAECGVASYYWQGKVTANGERYNPDGISAAHKSLPFGSQVLVRNQRTGRTITVRINDRGPFIKGRIIDLSRGANRVFGMDGVAPVCITVLNRGDGQRVASGSARARRVAYRQTRGTRMAARSRRSIRVASRGRRGVRVASRGGRGIRTASYRPRKMRVAKASRRGVRSASVRGRKYGVQRGSRARREAAARGRRLTRG